MAPLESQSLKHCRLIEGFFAQAVQILLGVVAIAALLVKYHLEINSRVPCRTFKEWMFDCTKQVEFFFAPNLQLIWKRPFLQYSHMSVTLQLLSCLHVSNSKATISLISVHCISLTSLVSDPVSFKNNFEMRLVDAVVGVALIIVALKGFERLARFLNWESVQERCAFSPSSIFSKDVSVLVVYLTSENYGDRNKPSWKWWFAQLMVYMTIVLSVKILLGLSMWPLAAHLVYVDGLCFSG